MALNWNWENKIGTCIISQEPTNLECNLYACNGLFVSLYEYKTDDGKDMYTLANFALDETHFKNCLGLDKKYPECNQNNILEYNLNVKFKCASQMAKCLLQAQTKEKWQGKLITYYEE